MARRTFLRILAAVVCLILASVACGEDEKPSDVAAGTGGDGTGGTGAAGKGGTGGSTTGGTGGVSGTGGTGGSSGTAGRVGVSGSAGSPDCFANPQNHFEIINACTDAQKIDKRPSLPLLQADGGQPPLP